jgi:hypothetical protein
MSGARRAWRSFRSLPVGAQVAAAVGLLAAYTVLLVVLVGGSDDGGGSSTEERAATRSRASTTPAARSSPLERRLKTFYAHVIETRPHDEGDVASFRRLRLLGVRCAGSACQARVTTALPGYGRIAEDQSQVVARVYRETPIERFAVTVYRGAKGSGTRPAEETPIGALVMRMSCDRSRKPALDVRHTSITDVLVALCTIKTEDPGQQQGGPPGQSEGQGQPGVIG